VSAFTAGWLVLAGTVGVPMLPEVCASAGPAIRLTAMTAAASLLNMDVILISIGVPRTLGLFGRPAWRRSLSTGCAHGTEPALKRAVIAHSNSGTGQCQKPGGIVTRLNFL
jgi:hypothetical protein